VCSTTPAIDAIDVSRCIPSRHAIHDGSRISVQYAPPFGLAMIPLSRLPVQIALRWWYVLLGGALLGAFVCLTWLLRPTQAAPPISALTYGSSSSRPLVLSRESSTRTSGRDACVPPLGISSWPYFVDEISSPDGVWPPLSSEAEIGAARWPGTSLQRISAATPPSGEESRRRNRGHEKCQEEARKHHVHLSEVEDSRD